MGRPERKLLVVCVERPLVVHTPEDKWLTVTLLVKSGYASVIATLLKQEAEVKILPSGRISRSGNGSYKWVSSFRAALHELADQLHEASRKALHGDN